MKMIIQRTVKDGAVDLAIAREAVEEFFAKNDYRGKRLLAIVPDHTRSGPVGEIFRMIFDRLEGRVKTLDVLVALGTHPPMTEEAICRRLAITAEQRKTKFSAVKLLNHEWDKADTYKTIGKISADEIHEISEGLFRQEVNVAINKLLFGYDEFFIIGPVFPHEVVGFSGGHKYIFPGISGAEIINFFHWLGAVITNPKVNGLKNTPMRTIVERAASFIDMMSAGT
jgi:nickel-dependent lactate racemase